ncbi:MAG TPA: S41 family peptidase, partial [Gemmataceae bacterium]|nr:S41 family peptidase [Gemmataceae bacterium]
MTRAVLAGLTALLTLVLPLRAAAEPRAYAVLVGVGRYADAAIQGRSHAEDDVRALYDLLTDPRHLGIPRDHVRLLLGAGPDKARPSETATRANVLAATRWVAAEAGPDDLVVFAWVGQGAALGERGDRIAYFAADSSVKDPARSAVLAPVLGEELDRLQSHRVCLFVDVSFKGYRPANGGAPAIPNPGADSLWREFLGKDKNEDAATAPGRVLFLASADGRFPSPDTDKHGTFTQVLLDGLQGQADSEGDEPDGVVTVDELIDYVDKELPARVKKCVANEKEWPGHDVLADEDAHFVLTRNPAVEPKVRERLEKLAAAVTAGRLPREFLGEGQALLSRMPKIDARRNLRREYQALLDGREGVDKFLHNRARLVAGTRLPAGAARTFAATVLGATRVVQEGYVKEVNQGQLVDWAVRGLYRKLDEKVPDDLTKKLANVGAFKERELFGLLADARTRLGKREDLDGHKDIDGALVRMLQHLDPYTTFYTPDDLKRLEEETSGQFIGVGVEVGKDPDSDELLVLTPIRGSPAHEAGVRAGDVITTLTRPTDDAGRQLDPPEVIPTRGMDISEAIKRIGGPPGTRLKLTVRRPGVMKPIEFELVRRAVRTESVFGVRRRADGDWEYWLDPDKRIAYVRLAQFQGGTTHDLAEAMAGLTRQGVRGLVLDLRGNPGGLLESACEVTDLFIGAGVIVEVRPRVGRPEVLRGRVESTYVYEDPATGEE